MIGETPQLFRPCRHRPIQRGETYCMADSAPTSPSPLRRKALLWACAFVAVFGATELVAARYLAHQFYTVQIPLSVLGLVLLTAGLLVAGAILHFVANWRRQV